MTQQSRAEEQLERLGVIFQEIIDEAPIDQADALHVQMVWAKRSEEKLRINKVFRQAP